MKSTKTLVSLHQLIEKNDINAIITLFSSASPEKISEMINALDAETKQTPIAMACKNGNLEIVSLLLQHGADVTLGGLRMRKCTFDYAQKFPEIAKIILPRLESYLDKKIQADPSLEKASDQEKAKVALLKFSLAHYYKSIGEKKKQESNFMFALKLTKDLTDTPSTTLSPNAQLSIQGPLNWRVFSYYLEIDEFANAMASYQLAQKKFMEASQNEKSNLPFERAMYFDTICALAMTPHIVEESLSNQAVVDTVNSIHRHAFQASINPSPLTTLSLLIEAFRSNFESLNYGYVEYFCTDLMKNHRTIIPNLNTHQTILILQLFATFYSACSITLKNQGHLSASCHYNNMVSAFLEGKFEKTPSKITSELIITCNKLDEDLNLCNQFITEINQKMEMSFKSGSFNELVPYLEKSLPALLAQYPNIRSVRIENVDALLAACFKYENKKAKTVMYVNNTAINDRLTKDNFDQIIKACHLFLKLINLLDTKSSILSQFRYVLTNLMNEFHRAGKLKAMGHTEYRDKLSELHDILLECEMAYIQILDVKQCADLDLIGLRHSTLFMFNFYRDPHSKLGHDFSMAVKKSSQLYKKVYDSIKSKNAANLIPQLSLAILCYVHYLDTNYAQAIEFAMQACTDAKKDALGDEYSVNAITVAMSVIDKIGSHPIFSNYDTNTLSMLHTFMENSKTVVDNYKQANLKIDFKIKNYAALLNFWSNQVEKLIENKLYKVAIKYQLFIFDSIILTLESTKKINSDDSIKELARDALMKLIKLFDLFMEQVNATKDNLNIHNDIPTIVTDIIDRLLDAKLYQQLNSFIEIIYKNQTLFARLKVDHQLLLSIIGKIEDNAFAREKCTSLPKLQFMVIEASLQADYDHSVAARIAAILASCHKSKELPDHYSAVMIQANLKMAKLYEDTKQISDALGFYEQAIQMCWESKSSDDDLRLAISQSSHLLQKLIEQSLATGNLPDAINLYDSLIDNYDCLADHENKDKMILAQINVTFEWASRLMQDNKLNKALKLFEQLQNQPAMLPANSELAKNIGQGQLQAESMIITATERDIALVQQEMNTHGYRSAQTLCEKLLKDLSHIKHRNDEVNKLIENLQALSSQAKAKADEIASHPFGSTAEVTTVLQPALKKKSKKKKKTGTTAPTPKSEAIKQDNLATLTAKAEIEALPEPVNTRPDTQKIGKRIEAKFIKSGTANFFPRLQTIPAFTALKSTNRVLYDQLKKAVLEGAICNKIGDSGIKYLGNDTWEAKVNSRARLFGKTVDGDDGFQYIDFDTYSPKGLH